MSKQRTHICFALMGRASGDRGLDALKRGAELLRTDSVDLMRVLGDATGDNPAVTK